MPNTSEIAALVLADWGETWETAAGTEFDAAFVRLTAKGEEAMAGRELQERGTLMILSGAIALDEDQVVTRQSDSTEWEIVTALPIDHGMQVFEIERMTRITLGKM